MDLYRSIIWPLLTRLDPERSHSFVLNTIDVIQRLSLATTGAAKIYNFADRRLNVEWHGLSFPNPIGLAAGADKDAITPGFVQALGFGFIEVGTVTPLPQPGNPRPRIFRIPRKEAMINSLGFPSKGAHYVAGRLQQLQSSIPVGINIGKNAGTSIEEASSDYRECLDRLYPFGDYFTINISSPNTPGLTSLQDKALLSSLAHELNERRTVLADAMETSGKPLLMKLSPDLTNDELDAAVDVITENGIDGIVAVNTSTSNKILAGITLPGGISGRPLYERAIEVIERIRRQAPPSLFIIGAGGVFDGKGAWDMLAAGANLIQVYTGLIYRGPSIAKSINKALASRLNDLDLSSVHLVNSPPPEPDP